MGRKVKESQNDGMSDFFLTNYYLPPCPILLDPLPPEIGHHLCTSPNWLDWPCPVKVPFLLEFF